MLTVTGLTRRYGQRVAVDNLSFVAKSGEVTGLLGHNGCGKSTTLRMLAGAMNSSGGTYMFNNIPGGVDSLALKQLTGYIPDIGGVFPRLSGWEHMELCARLFKLGKEPQWRNRAEDLLEALEIADAAPALAGTYSHGMGRKLSAAIAMLPGPELILADEPFDGVDGEGVKTITHMLKQRSTEGATVVLSTHLLDVAAALCTTTFTMHKGQLL